MTEYLVETAKLTKIYGRRRAVDDLDLRVRAGEVYGFLGPNGAGKTTTMKMLLGLIRPTSGTAEVLGAPPGDPAALAKIGMLVETPAFYPYLSGRDNLRVLARYAAVPESRIDAALETVDLSSRDRDRFATYSLGMKQRLGVAAALLKDPDLLIMDEPTNGLDPAGMADMRRLMRGLGDAGRTILLSSHMLSEVEEICDRVGVIFQSRLIREGTVDQLRGGGALQVTADPLDAAELVVKRLVDADHVTVQDGRLRLRTTREDAARINRELVVAGIDVLELTWAERTLEDVFLEMTTERPTEPVTVGRPDPNERDVR
ncbi:ABC transporter ATP-binding protein [Actinoallomurus bryophytorum]|uniref:ABC-2 type transport system ATP-binding protein n=1 Tax=Actinoallomurus bryophytorum TaxID=1490222 RepID=A0A543CUP3_9ACTN|nr:ATP-binding cassette domain-containing protein [Actinoallomurus bryophytorum]TQM00826.1 ABC-2 type transport system ATP-binding protein [Actinoallomurus bryophytorum]